MEDLANVMRDEKRVLELIERHLKRIEEMGEFGRTGEISRQQDFLKIISTQATLTNRLLYDVLQALKHK